MTMLRLTDAGRTAVMDGQNRALNNVQLRKMVIGDGTGPGGDGDDSRAALRSLKQTEGLVGTTLQAGRLAVRGEFTAAEVFSVTEVGIVARIGDAGAEFLLAFWTVPQASDALANTAVGVKLIIAGVLDLVAAAAEVSVTLSPTITFTGPGTLVALSDVPNAYSPDLYLRANNTGTAGVWDQAPPSVATEVALPAPAAAVVSTYHIVDYAGTGYPVLAVKDGNAWRYVHVPENFPAATTGRRGIVELETVAETLAGLGTIRAVTGAGVRAVRNALLGGAGAAYDTLKEIEDLLSASDTALAALMTAIANRITQAQGDARYARIRSNLLSAAVALIANEVVELTLAAPVPAAGVIRFYHYRTANSNRDQFSSTCDIASIDTIQSADELTASLATGETGFGVSGTATRVALALSPGRSTVYARAANAQSAVYTIWRVEFV